MDVIVSGISRNHESDRRDVQTGRVVGVGVTQFDGGQLMSLEIDEMSVELFGDDQSVRNLAWE